MKTERKTKTQVQQEKILRHLKSGRTLTQRQAKHLYGVGHLFARIAELRAEGYEIETEIHHPKDAPPQGWARYRMTKREARA